MNKQRAVSKIIHFIREMQAEYYGMHEQIMRDGLDLTDSVLQDFMMMLNPVPKDLSVEQKSALLSLREYTLCAYRDHLSIANRITNRSIMMEALKNVDNWLDIDHENSQLFINDYDKYRKRVAG